jgi:hypothetical protein
MVTTLLIARLREELAEKNARLYALIEAAGPIAQQWEGARKLYDADASAPGYVWVPCKVAAALTDAVKAVRGEKEEG